MTTQIDVLDINDNTNDSIGVPAVEEVKPVEVNPEEILPEEVNPKAKPRAKVKVK